MVSAAGAVLAVAAGAFAAPQAGAARPPLAAPQAGAARPPLAAPAVNSSLPSRLVVQSSTPTQSVAAGATVTIRGTVATSAVCPAGTPIQLTSSPQSGSDNLFPGGEGPMANRSATGAFSVSVAVPATTTPGSYNIGVRCNSAVGPLESLQVTEAPRRTPSIVVSPSTAAAGETVTIFGVAPTTGSVVCPADNAAQLSSSAALFPPDGFGPDLPRDPNGAFQVTYTIPSSTTPGIYNVGVRCGGGNLVTEVAIKINAAAPTTTSPVTAPGTTTTLPIFPFPATTLIPVTTLPVTPTTMPRKPNHGAVLKWVALGALLLVVVVVAVVLLLRVGR